MEKKRKMVVGLIYINMYGGGGGGGNVMGYSCYNSCSVLGKLIKVD